MKRIFDPSINLEDNILEGEENGQTQTGQSKESSAPERSREATSSSPNSSPSRTHQEALAPQEKAAAYYNGFNDGGRYV